MPIHDDKHLLVVSADSMRLALGRAVETADKNPPKLKLSLAERGAALARLATALKAMDEEAKGIDPKLLVAPGDQVASIIQSKIAEGTYGTLEKLKEGGYEIKFGTDDYVGWAMSVFSWIKISNHPQVPPKRGAIDMMPNDARIILMGDWGTGLYGARDSAKTISGLKDKYFMFLHLGDTYYSGTANEIRDRFLAFWPKRPRTINRSLNANHEMYSGGYGFFDVLMPAFQQPSSYFAYKNDNWLLVALDTAYVDHDVSLEQVEWLTELMLQAGNRQVILFSHHQPFSTLEKKGGKQLVESLRPVLASRSVKLWYWGHEHRCVWYDAHPEWGFSGRCVGHGGIPYRRDEPVLKAPIEHLNGQYSWRRFESRQGAPRSLVLDGPNESIITDDGPENYGPQGFVRLDFQGDNVAESVFLPDGRDVSPRS